jgi:hypothetical protein
MGVYSDGSYDAPKGVIYSFPVTCKGGKWSIVQVGRARHGLARLRPQSAVAWPCCCSAAPLAVPGLCVPSTLGAWPRHGLVSASSTAARPRGFPCSRSRVPETGSFMLHACLPLRPLCLQGLPIDDKSAAKMKATGEELVEEKALAMECLGEAA